MSGGAQLISSPLLAGLFSREVFLGRVELVEGWAAAEHATPTSPSLLPFRGSVAELGDGVESAGTDMVCHFSANSLKFFELGEFIPLLNFLCEIAKSFGLSFLDSSLEDLESFEIVSPIELELNPFEYFFSSSDHFFSVSVEDPVVLAFRLGFSSTASIGLAFTSVTSLVMSSEMAESLLRILQLRAKGAFSLTMLLFLLDLLE